MSADYSKLVSIDDLSEEQITHEAELAGVPKEKVRETWSNEPIIEIGREDDDPEFAPFKVGENSVIDPCPFCSSQHIHGFRDHIEGQGQVTSRSPNCRANEDEKY